MPAVKLLTIGLAKIEIGDLASDGDMGTSLEEWGVTEEDSCIFTIEEPTQTEFKVEELSEPILISKVEGAKSLAFTISDPDTDTLANVFGGTVDVVGTAPNQTKTFNAPLSTVTIEKSIRVSTAQGLMIEIPRAEITASMDTTIGRSALFTVNVTARVLAPKKVGVPAWRAIHVTGTGGA